MSRNLNSKLNLSVDHKTLRPSTANNTPKSIRQEIGKAMEKVFKVTQNIPMLPLTRIKGSKHFFNSTHKNPVRPQHSSFSNEISENLAPKASNGSLTSRKTYSMKEPSQLFESLKLPIAPAVALKLFKESLSDWEQSEILDSNNIYFLGLNAEKLKGGTGPNNGFDDNKGNYIAVAGDHIAYRYEVIQPLGKGSFGEIFKVYDHKKKEYSALKIIRNEPKLKQQVAVEVKVLKNLRDSDSKDCYNVIHMKNYFSFRKHLCITFELLSINLYEFIKSNHYHGLSLPLIRRFTIQIIQCLKLLKKLHIIHCDLKPENILLKQSNKSSIKVIDFGSSCYEETKLYTYIQSRFYRAPEIILGVPYSSAIDTWSLGCILVELYTGHPLFPGQNECQQLQYIMEVKGVPPLDLLQRASRAKYFFEPSGQPKLPSRGRKRNPGSKSLLSVLKDADKMFIDFVEKCLEWDPKLRLTPENAMRHPWIQEGVPRIHDAFTPRHAQKPSFKDTHPRTSKNTNKPNFVF